MNFSRVSVAMMRIQYELLRHTTDLTLRCGSVRCFTNSLWSPDRRSITESLEVFRIFQNLTNSFAEGFVTEVEALLVRGDSSGASWTALERFTFLCGEIMGPNSSLNRSRALFKMQIDESGRGQPTTAALVKKHHVVLSKSPCQARVI